MMIILQYIVTDRQLLLSCRPDCNSETSGGRNMKRDAKCGKVHSNELSSGIAEMWVCSLQIKLETLLSVTSLYVMSGLRSESYECPISATGKLHFRS
jgi:hypothetical protein